MKEKNHSIWRRILAAVFLALALLGALTGCAGGTQAGAENGRGDSTKATEAVLAESAGETDEADIDREGQYDQKEEVALYIHTYGELPDNYITKKEARALGWEGGALEPYAPGKSIGGDRFGNYEGQLPEEDGRTYKECDIDTKGKKRGSKRIVFSNDGLIYYTQDHYETFELLYGEEET